MRTCSVNGCGRKHWARGFCSTHYHKWYASNHPEFAKQAKKLATTYTRTYRKKHPDFKQWPGCIRYAKKEGKDKVRNLPDYYVRNVYRLPRDTPVALVNAHRKLILLKRSIRNECHSA